MRKIIYEEENLLIDEGVFFARGVFETILFLDKPIFLDEHIKRLKIGMNILGLGELEEDILLDFFEKVKIYNKAVKITVTPKNIIITKRDVPYLSDNYEKGARLIVSSVRRNTTSKLSYIKSVSYIENMLEKEEAIRKGFSDALLLNEKGYVSETTCANVFIIKDNSIITPPIEDGLLSGIIRGWIIENFKVYERSITLDDLEKADEVFITNSLMGIMPVRGIDRIDFTKEKVTDEIKSKYNKYIEKRRGK